jgi:hypothetical protein
VGERTRIVNRIKSTLARLGIRNFKPTQRKAADRLASVHTPEGMPLPPNTLAELQRDMARLGFVVSQIREIEDARQKRLEQHPETGPHAMVRLLARIVGVGVETADMLVHEVLSRPMRDRRAVARYAGLTGSPDEFESIPLRQIVARTPGHPNINQLETAARDPPEGPGRVPAAVRGETLIARAERSDIDSAERFVLTQWCCGVVALAQVATRMSLSRHRCHVRIRRPATSDCQSAVG